MHRAYRVLVASLAFAGSLSLVLSGELNPLFSLPGLAMIPGYYRYLTGREPANRWLIAGLALVELFVVAFDSLFVSGDFFIAVAHMTIVFQALKSFDLREPWDPLQVYFMSLLQLVITSELTLSITMGAVFVVFLFIFMAAMVFSHFMKEGTLERVSLRKPLVVVSLIAFIATSVFFVSIPRVRGGVLGRRAASAIKSVGFTEEIDLGSFGSVLESQTVVMRVELSGRRLPLYWRGLALDYFDGSSWQKTIKGKTIVRTEGGRAVIRPYGTGDVAMQKIISEPLDTDVVFGLGEIVAVETREWRVENDPSGSVFIPSKNYRRFTYTALSVPYGERPVLQRNNYLQLPPGLENLSALALDVTAQAGTDFERARALESFLMDNYSYSLSTSPPPPGMSPIEDFLFRSRRGFCEHYSTAMVLMLRALGIPARVVTGFKGGEVNDYGEYIILRQSNAHSWVEAAIEGRWRRFDPTPGSGAYIASLPAMVLDAMRMSWYRYVIGFSSRDQMRILESFSSPVFRLPDVGGIRLEIRPFYIIITLLASGAFLFVFLLKGRGQRRLPFESRAYLGFRRKLKKRGGRVDRASTPSEVLGEALRLSLDAGKAAEFVRLYEEARFGGRKLSAGEKRALKELV
jgi:transglutaminase-like putative cysteine protease